MHGQRGLGTGCDRGWPSALGFRRGAPVMAMFCVSFLWVSWAFAGIKTEVSARRVGVGQAIVVQLTARQEGDQPTPSDPQLRVGNGAIVQGPSVSTQSMVRMQNFSFTSEKNVIARFQVIPQKEGQLTIGPGSFEMGGRRVTGETIVIEVEKDAQPSQAPGRRRSDPFDVFGADPFGNDPLGGDPFDDFFGRRARRMQLPDAPAEYQLEHAADPVAFLKTQLGSKQIVVGEPVVLTVIAYGSQGDFVEIAPTEPALPDFLSFRAMDNLQSEPAYQTEIDGRVYLVRKIRQYIVVPLKAGKLKLGALSTVLQNNRRSYPARGHAQGYAVGAQEILLDVKEPPLDGRPLGYLVGDVGRYELQADVSQRTVAQGEFIEVILRVSGEGIIPSRVLVPEQNAVVWDAPSVQGGPEVEDGVLQGTRTLKYTVQLTAAGSIDLGTVTLPYFDHKTRSYAVAQVPLGKVEVTAASASQAPASPRQDPPRDVADQSAAIPAPPMQPRATLGSLPAATWQAPYWSFAAMFLLPLSLYVGAGLTSGTKRLLQARKTKARSEVKQDLKLGQAALKEGDKNRALQLAERALFDAMERSTGIKGRGVLRSEIAQSLKSRGVPEQVALLAQRCLQDLESSRYGSDVGDPALLIDRVEQVVKQLPRPRRGSS